MALRDASRRGSLGKSTVDAVYKKRGQDYGFCIENAIPVRWDVKPQ